MKELVFGPACSFASFLHLPLLQRCKESDIISRFSDEFPKNCVHDVDLNISSSVTDESN